jgi:hypothetical protein
MQRIGLQLKVVDNGCSGTGVRALSPQEVRPMNCVRFLVTRAAASTASRLVIIGKFGVLG